MPRDSRIKHSARRYWCLRLTAKEAGALAACLNGELENDDGFSNTYMQPLRRVLRKLNA